MKQWNIKINPVLKKEMKLSTRSFKLVLTLIGVNSVLALIAWVFMYLTDEYSSSFDYSHIITLYIFIVATEFAMLMLVVPAVCANSISGEREKQTLEVLLTTRMSPMSIVIGKIMSSLSTVILILISSFPIICVIFFIGGIRIINILQIFVFFILSAIFIGSIGVFYSTFHKKTVTAIVFTLVTEILLFLGTVCWISITYSIELNKMDYSITDVDLGILPCILLFNPCITLFVMLVEQVGSLSTITSIASGLGDITKSMANHWVFISGAVQFITSIGLLILSSRYLDPLNDKFTRKRKKLKKKKA